MKRRPPTSPQRIVKTFGDHLREVVGLAPSTCRDYSSELSRFLDAVPIQEAADLAALTPMDLTGYVTDRSAQCQPSSLQQVASALRQFLGFFHRVSISLFVVWARKQPSARDRTYPTWQADHQANRWLMIRQVTSTPN